MANSEIIRIPKSNIERIGQLIQITKRILGETDKTISKRDSFSLSHSDKLLVPFRDGKNWGYSDINKTIKIGCQYESTNFFTDKIAQIIDQGNKCFIDSLGNKIIERKINSEFYYPDTIYKNIIVRNSENGLDGIIDYNGNVILDFKYVIPFTFHNSNIAYLRNDDEDFFNEGFADIDNNYISEFKYCRIMYNENIFRVFSSEIKYGDKCGYIDRKENIIIPFIFEDGYNFHNGIAPVKKSGLWGYINLEGNTLLSCNYTRAREFNNNVGQVWKKRKWGIVNNTGDFIVPMIYERMEKFIEGLAAVRLNDKWGFINTRGEVIIDLIYDRADYFNHGTACVMKGRKFGLIDRNNDILIDFKFDSYLHFNYYGFALLRNHENIVYGIIDKHGNIILETTFNGKLIDDIDIFGDLFVLTIENKCGCIDKEKNILIPFEFDRLINRHGDFFEAYNDGKFLGYVRNNGDKYWIN